MYQERGSGQCITDGTAQCIKIGCSSARFAGSKVGLIFGTARLFREFFLNFFLGAHHRADNFYGVDQL